MPKTYCLFKQDKYPLGGGVWLFFVPVKKEYDWVKEIAQLTGAHMLRMQKLQVQSL